LEKDGKIMIFLKLKKVKNLTLDLRLYLTPDFGNLKEIFNDEIFRS
jgi:hypothetical protein